MLYCSIYQVFCDIFLKKILFIYLKGRVILTIFKGSGVALITPMKEDGSVDYEQLKELAEAFRINYRKGIID